MGHIGDDKMLNAHRRSLEHRRKVDRLTVFYRTHELKKNAMILMIFYCILNSFLIKCTACV